MKAGRLGQGIITGVFGLLLCAVCFLPERVVAAPAGISISPSVNEITLGSGLLKSDTKVTVTNTSDKAVTVLFSVADVVVDENGQTTLVDSRSDQKTSLAQWMTVAPVAPQALPAGGSVVVSVSIANDPDMAPGGHYGSLVATISGSTAGDGKVGLKQQLAASFLVTKSGNETYQLALRDIGAAAFRDVPARIDLPFQSTGNTHVVPRGTITIYDSRKRLVAKGVINDGSQVVFPGSGRTITVDLQRLATLPEHGRFQAVISYRHDKTDQFQTKTVDFTRGLPWLGTAIVIVGIVLGLMILTTLIVLIRHLRHQNIT